MKFVTFLAGPAWSTRLGVGLGILTLAVGLPSLASANPAGADAASPSTSAGRTAATAALGPYKMVNGFGRVLAVNGGAMLNGQKVVQWADTGTLDQFWYLDALNNGNWRIRDYKTDSFTNQYCLDVTGGSKAVGAKVQIWTCNLNIQQQWHILQLANGSLVFQNANSNLVLAVNGGDNVVGRDVLQWSYVASLDQQWDPV